MPYLSGSAFTSGRSVVVWPGFDSSVVTNAGALISLDGSMPTTGILSSAMAFIGSSPGEFLGVLAPVTFNEQMVMLALPRWDNGAGSPDAGAICLLDGGSVLSGQVNSEVCVLGTLAGWGNTMTSDYSARRFQVVVGLPMENKVVILHVPLFSDGFE